MPLPWSPLRRCRRWLASKAERLVGLRPIIVLTCVALIGLDGAHLWSQREQQLAEGRQDSANLARSLAQHADDTIRAVDAVTVGVVERLEHDPMDAASLARVAEALDARRALLPQVNGFAVADANGVLVITSRSTSAPVSIADRGYFQRHAAQADRFAHIGAPVQSRVTGISTIPVSRRFDHPDGSFAGVVVAMLDTRYFDHFYNQFEIGETGSLLLALSDGTLLVRRPFLEANVGRSIRDGGVFREQLPQGPSGVGEITSPTDGILRLDAWRRAQTYPLVIVAALGKSELLAGWRMSAWHNALVLWGLVSGILLLGARLEDHAAMGAEAHRAAEVATTRYRLLADNSSDMIFLLDLDFVRRYVSPACRELLGYEPEELVGAKPVNMIHPEDAERVSQVYRDLAAGRERAGVVNRIRHRDGRWIWVEATFRLILDEQSGKPRKIVGTLRDVTERVEAQAAVERSESQYRLLADNSSDVIMRVGPQGQRIYVSPACREVFGHEPTDLLSAPAGQLVHPDDRAAWNDQGAWSAWKGDSQTMHATYRVIHKDGTHVWVEARRRRLPENAGFVVAVRDISLQRRMQDELAAANLRLELLAAQDGLTALANRRRFDEALGVEFRRAVRDATSLALIMIDIDHFKSFNDRYGHPAGDDCLRCVASRIGAAPKRGGDLAARYGGEEFVVLLPNTGEAGAVVIAEQILAAVREARMPHAASEKGIVTISLGVAALVPKPDAHKTEDLVGEADRMLYAAKSHGRDMVVFSSIAVIGPSPMEHAAD